MASRPTDTRFIAFMASVFGGAALLMQIPPDRAGDAAIYLLVAVLIGVVPLLIQDARRQR